MIRITLTEDAKQELVNTFKTSSDRRLRDRCQAVLMRAEKRTQTAIARDLQVARRTIYNWLMAYQTGGLAGLKIEWGSGPAPRISDDMAPCIQAWVKHGPAGCGLNRANWTYAELADYLYKQTGILVAETTMRDFCHRHAIRPYRPSYRYLRADPEQKALAKEELETLKKSPNRGHRALEPG